MIPRSNDMSIPRQPGEARGRSGACEVAEQAGHALIEMSLRFFVTSPRRFCPAAIIGPRTDVALETQLSVLERPTLRATSRHVLRDRRARDETQPRPTPAGTRRGSPLRSRCCDSTQEPAGQRESASVRISPLSRHPPTVRNHLGNYIGSIAINVSTRSAVRGSFCIATHAITVPPTSPGELRGGCTHARVLLAAA